MAVRASRYIPPGSARYGWMLVCIPRTILLVLVLAAVSITSASAKSGTGPVPAAMIYVSPLGSDANPGTQSAPLRTLARAQMVVRSLNRNMTANITVYLADGTYRLSKPLAFGPLDSGSNGYDVVWTAAPTATAVISGAERITGWRLSDLSKGIWVANVPRTLRTRQIYVNGARSGDPHHGPRAGHAHEDVEWIRDLIIAHVALAQSQPDRLRILQ